MVTTHTWIIKPAQLVARIGSRPLDDAKQLEHGARRPSVKMVMVKFIQSSASATYAMAHSPLILDRVKTFDGFNGAAHPYLNVGFNVSPTTKEI